MRYYPTGNPYYYMEAIPTWSRSCRTPEAKWKMRQTQKPHTICYYRDLEGSKIHEITDENLFAMKLDKTLIRREACLPLYYGMGERFIRIVKAEPAGFKCAPLPINLAELRHRIQLERHLAMNKGKGINANMGQDKSKKGAKKKSK